MGFTLNSGSLIYLGAFAVPQGTIGSSSFGYANGFMGYRPDSGTLFIVGHDHQQSIAEISIPILKTGSVAGLNTATLRQTFSNVYSRAPVNVGETGGDDNLKAGGMLVVNNKLIATEYIFYDADYEAVRTHYVMHGMNLASSPVSGTYKVGSFDAGFIDGYMGTIPDNHSGTIGKRHITGNSSLSIIGRTSSGPALFAFNAEELLAGPTGTVNARELVYYPLSNQMAGEATTNPVWNLSSYIRGVVFPSGSDTVLFFGSHGTGFYWYGDNGDIPGVNDPARGSKGSHAYPYRNQIWAYPVSGLMRVMSGLINPWEAPYTYWHFRTPYDSLDSAKDGPTVAYDQTGNRLFVMEPDIDSDGFDPYPVIHVYRISGSDSQSSGGGGGTAHEGQFGPTLTTNISITANVTSSSSGVPAYRGMMPYLGSGLLEHLFRANTLGKPNLWLALCGRPGIRTSTISTLDEIPHGNGYSRVNITGSNLWSIPTQPNISGNMFNQQQINFPAAQSNWGWVSGWAILDNSGDGAGNILFMGCPTAKYILPGDVAKFVTGSLQINIG